MIDLLVTLIIFAVVFGLLYWLVTLLPIPEPFGTIVRVGAILLCIVLLVSMTFGGVAMPTMRLGR